MEYQEYTTLLGGATETPVSVSWEESVGRKQRDAEILLEYYEARLRQAYGMLHETIAHYGTHGWTAQQRDEVYAARDTVNTLRVHVQAQRTFVNEIARLTATLRLQPELGEIERLARADW